MQIKQILIACFWFILGHTAVWFQLNGQFIWPWFRKNEWVLACTGVIISFFYIWGTKAGIEGFGGLFWPNRFLGFSIGIFIYGVLISIFFNEGINMKTAVSLLLCLGLIAIQVLWK